MIELMFPQTVSNILDYDGIKAAAKKYVEDIFVQITESFGNNLVLQSMDEEHLAEVARHVTGNSELSLEELLSYMNTENIYRECDFVSDLLTAFPSGVEYLEFEVTGWGFPSADFAPFNEPERSYAFDGTPSYRASDDVWAFNTSEGNYVSNLLLSRYKGQLLAPAQEPNWHKKSGRRSSWGNTETWMTTGGFGKPGTIHINVDEERSVIEENGLTAVENWLGTVANKLPINLYIEINSNFTTNAKPASSSFAGYHMAFPYEEEEGFCTNDPDWPKEAYNWLESVKLFPIGGSMGVNYSESVMGYLPKRMERGSILFTGELRESIIPSSGVVEELEQNSIEVLFGVYANRYTGEWLAYTIGVYNTQKGCVLSQEDDDALHDFGLETTGFIGAYGTGPYGCVVWDDSYTFEPLALYTDITGTTLDTDDMSNFTCVKTNDWVGIKMISEESGSYDHSTATMAWKCRITKNS